MPLRYTFCMFARFSSNQRLLIADICFHRRRLSVETASMILRYEPYAHPFSITCQEHLEVASV